MTGLIALITSTVSQWFINKYLSLL